jgi:hypothetical protein
MPVLELVRDGSTVTIKATAWAANTTFSLVYQAGAEWAARLLARELGRCASERMRQARQEAYTQGWKDAKAKRRKETWFSGELP